MIPDNIRIHHAKLLQSFPEENREHLELVFLPPYSPDLKKIEELWGWMKDSVINNVFFHSRQEKNIHYLVSLVIVLICFGIDSVVLYHFSHMNGIYAGHIPAEISNRYQAAIVAAIAGIFALYNALVFNLTVIRRHRKWKNRNINSVLIGNLFQKVSSAARVLNPGDYGCACGFCYLTHIGGDHNGISGLSDAL